MVWDVCAKAINAFYSREKVIMMANVNLHGAYTNDIVDLQLAKCHRSVLLPQMPRLGPTASRFDDVSG